MDSKTRVIMSLGFEKPDRIAISDAYWPEFQEKCIEELKLNKDINISDFFNNDVYVACPDETPFPLDAAVISESESDIVERNGWGAVVRTKKNAYFYEELSVKIQDKKDIRKVVFDDPGLDMRYLEFEKEVVVEKNKGKCVFGKIGGPFIRTEFLRGQMQYLLDIVEDPEFVKEMVERMTDHLISIAKEEIRRGFLYDTGIMISDDMGNNINSMMSPKSFEKIFYPAYKRLINCIKKEGAAKVILDSDGNIVQILDMLLDAGIDVITPVEPKAGMSLKDLIKKYDKKLAFIGGMCNAFILREGTEDEIGRKTMEIIELGKDGGIVIGTHSIGPDISVKNYLAYHNCVMNEGWYV